MAQAALDTGHEALRESLDLAERRLREGGAAVRRGGPADVGEGLTPAVALPLGVLHPAVRELALMRGQDPDAPPEPSKVTRAT